jgi:hypothetical protein
MNTKIRSQQPSKISSSILIMRRTNELFALTYVCKENWVTGNWDFAMNVYKISLGYYVVGFLI